MLSNEGFFPNALVVVFALVGVVISCCFALAVIIALCFSRLSNSLKFSFKDANSPIWRLAFVSLGSCVTMWMLVGVLILVLLEYHQPTIALFQAGDILICLVRPRRPPPPAADLGVGRSLRFRSSSPG